MDDKTKEGRKIVKIKNSNIIKDKRQIKVGIPKDIVEALKIDAKIDIITWSIIADENKQISLEGHLIKGGRKNEKT